MLDCDYVHNLNSYKQTRLSVILIFLLNCDRAVNMTPPHLQDLRRAHGCLWQTLSY